MLFQDEESALYSASFRGFEEVVRILMEHNADPHIYCKVRHHDSASNFLNERINSSLMCASILERSPPFTCCLTEWTQPNCAFAAGWRCKSSIENKGRGDTCICRMHSNVQPQILWGVDCVFLS